MLKTEIPSQGLLFASFLYRSEFLSGEEAAQFWERHFGKSFEYTPQHNPLEKYYSKEMGLPLERKFFVSTTSFPREFLLSTKLLAIEWEKKWAENDQRRVNVDIGFISAENFLLATTKNYSHRVYIGKNIFADLTYYFHEGKCQTLPWTYPDYLDEDKKNFISWCRSYLLQLRQH